VGKGKVGGDRERYAPPLQCAGMPHPSTLCWYAPPLHIVLASPTPPQCAGMPHPSTLCWHAPPLHIVLACPTPLQCTYVCWHAPPLHIVPPCPMPHPYPSMLCWYAPPLHIVLQATLLNIETLLYISLSGPGATISPQLQSTRILTYHIAAPTSEIMPLGP
jgi:hypothetical protein